MGRAPGAAPHPAALTAALGRPHAAFPTLRAQLPSDATAPPPRSQPPPFPAPPPWADSRDSRRAARSRSAAELSAGSAVPLPQHSRPLCGWPRPCANHAWWPLAPPPPAGRAPAAPPAPRRAAVLPGSAFPFALLPPSALPSAPRALLRARCTLCTLCGALSRPRGWRRGAGGGAGGPLCPQHRPRPPPASLPMGSGPPALG